MAFAQDPIVFQRRIEELARQDVEAVKGMLSNRERMVPADRAALVDVPVFQMNKVWYDTVQAELDAAGVRVVGDFLDANASDRPRDKLTCSRLGLSDDGTIAATWFAVPVQTYGVRRVILESWGDDERSLTTGAGITDAFPIPPAVTRSILPAGAPIPKLLKAHRAQIKRLRLLPRRMHDIDAIRAAQDREWETIAAFRREIGLEIFEQFTRVKYVKDHADVGIAILAAIRRHPEWWTSDATPVPPAMTIPAAPKGIVAYPVSEPAPAALVRPLASLPPGDGYTFSGERERATMTIARWTADVEHALAEVRPTGVYIKAGFEGDAAALRALPRLAPQLEYLAVDPAPKIDLGFVAELTDLRKVVLRQMTGAPSFAALRQLTDCTLDKPATIGRLYEAPALETLSIEGVSLRNFGELGRLASLRTLWLTQSSVETLDGIAGMALTTLNLIYNRRLKSIAALSGMQSLEELDLTGSGGITDLRSFGGLTGLRQLVIQSGPALPGFEFLSDSPSLRTFALQNTNMAGSSCSIAPFVAMRELENFSLYAGPSKGFACIRDLERLGEVTSLGRLRIDRGPDLPNIGFVRHLARLVELNLTRTNIVDGDLSPILDLPLLRSINVLPHRKHYSHSMTSLLHAWNERQFDRGH